MIRQSAINAVQAWIAYDLPPQIRDSLSPQLLEALYTRLDGESKPEPEAKKPEPEVKVDPKPKPIPEKPKLPPSRSR